MKKPSRFKGFLVHLLAAALLGACASAPRPARATAPTYHRFWRGKKLENLGFQSFAATLNDRFVPATVQVGAGNGLIAYEPLLLDPSQAAQGLPDEIALVTYSDEEAYDALRATPAGQAYGESHWQLFDRTQSGSLVPQPYGGALRIGAAFDLDPSYADWQKGFTRVVIGLRSPGMEDAVYLTAIQAQVEALRARPGLQDAALLVDPAYVIEYQSWKSQEVAGAVPMPGLSGVASWDLEAQRSGSTRLLPGTGINVRF
jgi:hypothetical protein